MNRRKFIRNLSYSGAGAMMVGGLPVKALSGKSMLDLAAMAESTDSVLVFIQLHGGNDALNTLIPISQYDRYYQIRANLAIPNTGTNSYKELDSTVGELSRVGVHPEMTALKTMYDEGKVAVVQNVGYPRMNGSHFEGRDLVFMGADGQNEDTYSSGWMGRFLDSTYPGYPDAYPKPGVNEDPLGIELSGTQSLAYHRKEGIPIGLAFNSPNGFHELINSVGLEAPIKFPDSHAGEEIKYIMEFEKKNNQYAKRLKTVYEAGTNSLTYPDEYPRFTPENTRNPLAPQLKLVARLLSGGIKTRVFLCRMGGFDTHGDQVVSGKPWLGHHAALMYHLSEGVKAFYDDMKTLGVDNKVLSMTFTEFGRRAFSNDSLGTDHGTSTPVLLFGTSLNAGIYGQNPSLAAEDLPGGNLKYNIDYRQIYTSVVQDWFGANNAAMQASGFDQWVSEKLPLINTSGIDETPYRKNESALKILPNPVKTNFKVEFFLKKPDNYSLVIFNVEGKRIYEKQGSGVYGMNAANLDATEFSTGKYIVQVRSGGEAFTSSMLKK